MRSRNKLGPGAIRMYCNKERLFPSSRRLNLGKIFLDYPKRLCMFHRGDYGRVSAGAKVSLRANRTPWDAVISLPCAQVARLEQQQPIRNPKRIEQNSTRSKPESQ